MINKYPKAPPINPVKATGGNIVPKKAAPEPLSKTLSASDFWTITGDELVQHWGVDASIIEQFVLEHGLPVRDSKNRTVINVEAYKASYRRDLEKIQFRIYLAEGPFNRFQFRPCDIEAFEKQHGGIFEGLRKQITSIREDKGIQKDGEVATVENYIGKRRAEGAHDDIIAFELHDQKGDFKLTYLKVARALKLDEGEIYTDVTTLKKRGERACLRGVKMLKKPEKTTEQ